MLFEYWNIPAVSLNDQDRGLATLNRGTLHLCRTPLTMALLGNSQSVLASVILKKLLGHNPSTSKRVAIADSNHRHAIYATG